jgi:Ca2+-binding RTX toxin-like protein
VSAAFVLLALAGPTGAFGKPTSTLVVRAGTQAVLGAAAPAPARLVLEGTGRADHIRLLAGRDGALADLDGDGRADVALSPGARAPSTIVIDAGPGNDVIDGRLATSQLIIDGGPGDDEIIGGAGSDTLIGGPGNDVIQGVAVAASCTVTFDANGNVSVVATGGDTVDYSGSTGPVTVDLDPGEKHPGVATGPEGTDVLQNVEHVIGSPFNDTISGDNAGNALRGGGGDDTIAGDAGNDCELGGDGNDTFDENEGTSTGQGGTGTNNGADWLFGNAGADDTVTYSSRTTRVVVALEPFFGTALDGADVNGDGDAADVSDEQDHVYLDTENAIGGSGNDILSANFVNNRADNELTGNAGNDFEIGGAGNDTFHEGAAVNGADDMDGGTGTDTCDYSQRTAGVTVSLEGDDNDGEPGEGDNCGGVRMTGLPGEGQPSSLSNVENVQGGSGNDVLKGQPGGANVLAGNAGNDVVSGFSGTDVLTGGSGDDILAGGPGNDSLDGGDGTDTADFLSAGNSGVRVDLVTGVSSGEGNDTLAAIENVNGSSFADSIRGDDGANVLNGRGGADAIQAAGGDDTVNGGDAADELSGGAGNDVISGSAGPDSLRGGVGDDTLSGGPGADTVLGGDGNDSLAGGTGRDDLRGGPGSDACDPGTPGLAHGDRVTGCES